MVNAIRKYGIDNFKCEILLKCAVHELDLYEAKFINMLDCVKNGLNTLKGGTGHRAIVKRPRPPISDLTRQKMSKARLGKKRPFTSLEARRNMSKAQMGKKLSDAHKKKVSDGVKKYWEKKRAHGTTTS